MNSWLNFDSNEANTRIFTRLMKEECWKRSRVMEGRDPERWRLDAAGNPVSYRLRGCEGCLCHEYDHIIPFSKGGRTEVDNCQILQTRVNRYKGNEDNDPKKLAGYSCARSYSGSLVEFNMLLTNRYDLEKELDLIEIALYGNIKKSGLECRQYSIFELITGDRDKVPSKHRSLPNCPP